MSGKPKQHKLSALCLTILGMMTAAAGGAVLVIYVAAGLGCAGPCVAMVVGGLMLLAVGDIIYLLNEQVRLLHELLYRDTKPGKGSAA